MKHDKFISNSIKIQYGYKAIFYKAFFERKVKKNSCHIGEIKKPPKLIEKNSYKS